MEGAADAQRLAAQTDVRALLELKKTAADSAAQRGGAARRKALQAHTPSVYKNREEKRWQEALSHETPRPPPKATMEEVGEYKLGRALVVPVRFGEPIFENRQQIAEYLTEFSARNPLIDEKNQIAHLVVSWEADSVHPGAMVATADRMLRRLGIDSDENRVVALAHLDGQHAHLHLLVGRTRSDGGAWMGELGVDRALALEAEHLAYEHGQPGNKPMVARTKIAGIASGRAARGELFGDLLYPDGHRVKILWQGEAVQRRHDASWTVGSDHAGVCIAQLKGYRPVKRIVAYAV